MYRFLRARVFCALVCLAGAGCAVAPLTHAQSAAAPAKELTVQRIYSVPSLSGHLTNGIEWTPDGKRISYIVRQGSGSDAPAELWTMDGTTGERKMLVGTDTLKAVTEPEKQKTIQS